jgi:hypothetical protein
MVCGGILALSLTEICLELKGYEVVPIFKLDLGTQFTPLRENSVEEYMLTLN